MAPTTDDPDRPLVRRAQQGDYAAFESLVARHERRLFGLALRIVGRRHDAEEVVQQTFVSVIEHLGEFREEALFSTWLMRVATNHALGLLRKRSRQRTVPLGEDTGDEGYDSVPHPEFIAQWRETPEDLAARVTRSANCSTRPWPNSTTSTGWSSCSATSRAFRPKRRPTPSTSAHPT